ncbi:hypothetical protein LCGC14_2033680 [marine sediment metagenome]|uniref:Nuclease associated modular domain-containing protein n=1 Tax=marine sediment metagenome TaxID=412755 RepID=A0A0F9ETV4_9ZZZZ
MRICPGCDKLLSYCTKTDRDKANKKSSVCKSCSKLSLPLPVGMMGKGKQHSENTKRKISLSHRGKKHTFESRRKMRLAAIRRIERNEGQCSPNYNPTACKLIEEYGKRYGYNFQHAENGGEFHIKELGYWVDGYDAEKNVVIEHDESYHFQQKEKDEARQEEIERLLGCEFIRIS